MFFAERKGQRKGKGVYASLFGVGAPEALVIGVVALLVFGPKGLAEVRSSFFFIVITNYRFPYLVSVVVFFELLFMLRGVNLRRYLTREEKLSLRSALESYSISKRSNVLLVDR